LKYNNYSFVNLLIFHILNYRSAVALTYFAIQYSFILTLLTYGILNGIGVGISYLTPLEIAMRVFIY
jgi:hypothetical protein